MGDMARDVVTAKKSSNALAGSSEESQVSRWPFYTTQGLLCQRFRHFRRKHFWSRFALRNLPHAFAQFNIGIYEVHTDFSSVESLVSFDVARLLFQRIQADVMDLGPESTWMMHLRDAVEALQDGDLTKIADTLRETVALLVGDTVDLLTAEDSTFQDIFKVGNEIGYLPTLGFDAMGVKPDLLVYTWDTYHFPSVALCTLDFRMTGCNIETDVLKVVFALVWKQFCMAPTRDFYKATVLLRRRREGLEWANEEGSNSLRRSPWVFCIYSAFVSGSWIQEISKPVALPVSDPLLGKGRQLLVQGEADIRCTQWFSAFPLESKIKNYTSSFAHKLQRSEQSSMFEASCLSRQLTLLSALLGCFLPAIHRQWKAHKDMWDCVVFDRDFERQWKNATQPWDLPRKIIPLRRTYAGLATSELRARIQTRRFIYNNRPKKAQSKESAKLIWTGEEGEETTEPDWEDVYRLDEGVDVEDECSDSDESTYSQPDIVDSGIAEGNGVDNVA